MSFFVKSIGAAYTNNVGSTRYPVLRGCVGAFIFDSIANRLKNWAPGGGPLTEFGTVAQAGYAVTVGYGTNYLLTDLADDTQDLTLIAIFKKTNATTESVVFGSRNIDPVAVSAGSTISKYHDTVYNEVGTSGGGLPDQMSIADAIDGQAVFTAMRGTGSPILNRSTTGINGVVTHVESTTGYVRALDPTVPFQVGARNDQAWTTPVDVYMAAVHNLALTDAEIEQIYTFFRAKYAALGVTL